MLRCVQSAYSELMGLYPPGANRQATELPEPLRDDLGPARPPFNVRDTDEISARLGAFALPFGFTAAIVMSPEATHKFNFRDEGCPYLDMRDMEGRTSLDTTPGYPELAD